MAGLSTRRRSRVLLGVAASAVLVTTSACTSSEDSPSETGQPVSPPAVELAPEGVPDDVSIGVVVSLTSAPGEGAQWNEAAEGARVAAYRYGLGDVDVTLVPRDDRGTADGADAAVRELAEEGVSGIVMATEGKHVTGALDAASELGVPVLLPYADSLSGLPEGVWTTGADAAQVSTTLSAALEPAGVSRPAVVDAGGAPVDLDEAGTLTLRPGGDATGLANRIRNLARSAARADSVVVTGPAALQAQMVQALQERNIALPVFLTGDAVSPAFAQALDETGASLSAPLTTAGLDTDDVAALAPGTEGAAVSAYLAALRVTAEDGGVTDFFDDEKFETVAGAADARSHDAVVALVTAAAAAGSAEPAEVRDTLAGLTPDASDGLAGPALDFSSPAAVSSDAVVSLQATTQDPGLRPIDLAGAPRLYWFESPTA
jgi:hypothetical protein